MIHVLDLRARFACSRIARALVLIVCAGQVVSCSCSPRLEVDAGTCANGGASATALEEWCVKTGTATFCEGGESCGDLQLGLYEQCTAYELAGCRIFAAANACTVRLDPMLAEQCVRELLPTDTQCPDWEDSVACQNALAPLGRLGDPCSADAERSCAEGYCHQGEQCPGECRAFAGEGEVCGPPDWVRLPSIRCDPSTICVSEGSGVDTGRCRRYPGEGERCDWGTFYPPCDPRIPSLHCPWPPVDAGACAILASEHQPCSAARNCERGLACSDAGTCEVPRVGDPCDVGRPCGSTPTQTCAVWGRCELLPLAPGSPCRIRSPFAECYPLGRCAASDAGLDDGGYLAEGTCVVGLSALGESCDRTTARPCEAPGACHLQPDGGSSCARALHLGEPCDPSVLSCLPGTFCDAASERCVVNDEWFETLAASRGECGTCDAMSVCSAGRCRPVCRPGL